MNKQSLQELRDKVAAGEAERFDPLFEFGLYQLKNDMKIVYLANDANLSQNRSEGSLDAAVAFLEAVLPGCEWVMRTNFDAEYEPRFFANVWCGENPNKGGECYPVYADTPARALLLATLSALIERAE